MSETYPIYRWGTRDNPKFGNCRLCGVPTASEFFITFAEGQPSTITNLCLACYKAIRAMSVNTPNPTNTTPRERTTIEAKVYLKGITRSGSRVWRIYA